MALKAKFTDKDIEKDCIHFEFEVIQEIIQKFIYIGEQFVNKARMNGNYRDRTGNLRSSIGYVVALDGEIVSENFEGKEQEGIDNAKQVAQELLEEYNSGIVLMGFAGMDYGIAVESRGYDVISSSIPIAADILKDLLK